MASCRLLAAFLCLSAACGRADDGTNVWIGAKSGGRWSYTAGWYARSAKGYSAADLLTRTATYDFTRVNAGAVMKGDWSGRLLGADVLLPKDFSLAIRTWEADADISGAVDHSDVSGLGLIVDGGGLVRFGLATTLTSVTGSGVGGGVVCAAPVTLDAGPAPTTTVFGARFTGGTLVKKGARQTLVLTGANDLAKLDVREGVVELARVPVALPAPAGRWTYDDGTPDGCDAVLFTEQDGRVTKGLKTRTSGHRPVPRGTLAETLTADGSFTLSARVGSAGDTGTFLMFGDGSDARTVRLRRETSPACFVAVIGTQTNDFGSAFHGGTASAGDWTHLTVTYDAGPKTLSFYCDAVLTGRTNATVRINPQDLVFGAGGLSSSTGVASAFKRNWALDDLCVYATALTDGQVAEHVRTVRMGGGAPVLSPRTVVEVAAGAVLRVRSGNVHVAELKGAGWVEVKDGAAFSADRTSGFSGALDEVGTELVIRADTDWIPLETFRDVKAGTALDFTAIAGVDAPAGKHGRVVARGAHFEFENLPGVPQRFFGAQISDTATVNVRNADADRLAEQFVRRGYNAVRLHHQDKVIVTTADPGGTNLNTYAMGRFEYLVNACVSRGLYLTTDLYASRSAVQWSSVGHPERTGTVSSDDYKYLVMVDENVKRNLKDFARNFLLHRNPYTGRSLAEEPALIGLGLVNESQKALFATPQKLVAEHPVWGEKWSAWVAKKKASSGVWANVSEKPPASVTGSGETGYAFAAFTAETERAFAREMKTFLRDELGCRAPLTALNGASDSRACFEVARGEYDYVDWHGYVDHPTFLGERWKTPTSLSNKNTIRFGGRGVIERAWMRMPDRPVTASEWQYAAPGQYRAAGGLLMGAYAAVQGFGGIWRFAYAESVGAATNATRKAIGFFESTGDPISLAGERAAACLYRRGDLPEHTKEYLNQMNPLLLNKPQEALVKSINSQEGTQWAAWYAKIGTILSTNAFTKGEISAGVWPGPVTNNKNTVMAHLGLKSVGDNAAGGRISVRNDLGSFVVKTETTAGGYAESGTIDGGAFQATLSGGPAAVWASTLDGRPFAQSDHILVSHLTDAVNYGIRFSDATRTTLLDWGTQPQLMRAGVATVSLTVGEGRFAVYALARDGTRRRKVPFAASSGRLTFVADIAADPKSATCLYEIERRIPFTVYIK